MSRLLLLICLAATGPVLSHEPNPHHHSVHDPVTFSIYQRSSKTLDVHDSHLTLSLGDITAGQVMTRMHHHDGHRIGGFPRSMRPGDHWSFTEHGHYYLLSLLSLRNELIGNDSAIFRIEFDPHHPHHHHGLTENEQIERLINAMAELDDAIMLRNGDAYSAEKAASHLERKWAWKRSQISTADDFIKVVATRSSETGERYQIRLADGQVIDSAQWFRSQLHEILQSEMHATHDH